VTADQKRHETAVFGLHDIRGQNGQCRHGTDLSILCLSRIEQNRIRPLFNATTDAIGCFTLMASALPFWAMRLVAREKEGAIKIDIPWKKRARFIQLIHGENNDNTSNTFTAETLGQGSKQHASSKGDSSLCEQGGQMDHVWQKRKPSDAGQFQTKQWLRQV
jgi:hypothetical protein